MTKDSNSTPALFPFDERLVFSVSQMHNNGVTKEVVAYGIRNNNTPIVCSHNGSALIGDAWFEVRFHCKEHPNMQVECEEPSLRSGLKSVKTTCPLCTAAGKAPYHTHFSSLNQMEELATSIFNSPFYNHYNLVRINDVYVPEAKLSFSGDKVVVKTTEKLPDDYKVCFDIKEDSSGHKIVMMQIFKSDSPKGAQFFIKPEQGQVVSDHNNPTPGEFIAEIAVRFSDRTIVQTFDGSNNPADKGL